MDMIFEVRFPVLSIGFPQNVYFDDIAATYYTGRMLQNQVYYPHWL